MVGVCVDKRPERAASGSSVSYEKEFNCGSSLKAIFGMIVPCCGCQHTPNMAKPLYLMSSIVTGTIFGQRKGRVNFCVQEDPGGPPLLFLEFATPTYVLMKEMQSGLLRITLKCEKGAGQEELLGHLFCEPVWSMYCNGRKMGFALRKQQKSESDPAIVKLMSLMQSVSTGAGVIPAMEDGKSEGDDLMYMRATYERVVGSSDSEAYHMINPGGTPGQELSIFLNRS